MLWDTTDRTAPLGASPCRVDDCLPRNGKAWFGFPDNVDFLPVTDHGGGWGQPDRAAFVARGCPFPVGNTNRLGSRPPVFCLGEMATSLVPDGPLLDGRPRQELVRPFLWAKRAAGKALCLVNIEKGS